jgi:hypothetical protein
MVVRRTEPGRISSMRRIITIIIIIITIIILIIIIIIIITNLVGLITYSRINHYA